MNKISGLLLRRRLLPDHLRRASKSATRTMPPLSKKFKKEDGEPSSSESIADVSSTADQPETTQTIDGVVSDIFLPSANPLYEPPTLTSEQKKFINKINQSRKNWGSPMMFPYRMERVRPIIPATSPQPISPGQCVLYWMSRDTRVQDNWAFIHAQRMALQARVPLLACFCLVPKYLGAPLRHFQFLLGGLVEVQKECSQLNIPFHMLIGFAKDVLPQFLKDKNVGLLVNDFSPLKGPMSWMNEAKERMDGTVAWDQVDAHNIVPCWTASDKEEYGARTLRSKIHKVKDRYLTPFPAIVKHPYSMIEEMPQIDWVACEASLEVDRSIGAVDWAKAGTSHSLVTLHSFITKRLPNYGKRNDPNVPALSQLSPWFHYGQISVARAILETEQAAKDKPSLRAGFDTFFEEAVIRRELSDNFCFYNSNYDNIDGAKPWAKQTLLAHMKDKRPILYTFKELEECRTADDLWNAAQMQMNREGKCHGFMRMYWAKKILEWTENPQQALEFSIKLNDKYSLDGRDPNGYVGCMWSICGTHDQGWAEREVFGKIRYMNYNGCKRKFDVAGFVSKYSKYFPKPVAVKVKY
ncbi:hypothetical protein RvY_06016 [Ramazzottius varieornatus]|uniref:Deoxyribodipyrimidine photo-lyase n=1 Tax=Ramazzottius varieornatus TaxID=947166 RepID=A0A1D1UX49_RAMVA|nr:hypothetical protein RvY_06016 [Ramazzottius varieornatus]